MRVHDPDCKYVAGSANECECRYADDEEWSECAHCAECTAVDSLVHHGDDFDLCPKCSDEWIAHVANCFHDYDPMPFWDDFGDEGRCCGHCGCFVDRDLAMVWAPFVCDGFVDVPDA